MKTASSYPVTYTYGWHPDYPLNGGFHNGEDRAMPVGTPIVVNKTKLGLSGNTGATTGPHLHISRYRYGRPVNPKGTGFTLRTVLGRTPTVVSVGKDAWNGNYVRVRNWRGEIFIYDHLSKISVKVGDKL